MYQRTRLFCVSKMKIALTIADVKNSILSVLFTQEKIIYIYMDIIMYNCIGSE